MGGGGLGCNSVSLSLSNKFQPTLVTKCSPTFGCLTLLYKISCKKSSRVAEISTKVVGGLLFYVHPVGLSPAGRRISARPRRYVIWREISAGTRTELCQGLDGVFRDFRDSIRSPFFGVGIMQLPQAHITLAQGSSPKISRLRYRFLTQEPVTQPTTGI